MMISAKQLADIITDSVDLKWGRENHEDGMGHNYHQNEFFKATIENDTLVIGAGFDAFYYVPINIALLRERLDKFNICLTD